MPNIILIVDDSEEDRVAYARYLMGEREGAYRVRQARNGEEGLAICNTEAIDCVLLDYNLPDIDGIEFLMRLRGRLGELAPAVVMLTGKGNELVAAESIKAGARDYLVKGMASQEVVRAIQNAIHEALHYQRSRSQQLRDYSEQLARTDRAKDTFLATLAHELRNPLSPIGMSMEVLLRLEPDSAHVARAASVVKRQVHHLTHLLDDLLDVARITNDKITLQRRELALAEVIARLVDQCHPAVERAGQTLKIIQPGQPIMIDADPVRLVQAIANVLNNASKFSPRSGEIVLDIAQEGCEIIIRVTDQGVGLAPDSLENIFGMFAQADNASMHLGGLGVGLSLARRFAEMHGGSVRAHSAGLGRGCAFTLRFPIIIANELPANSAVAERTVSPKRVLVVDDNRDAADGLCALLELEGHLVTVAYDGFEAIEKASSQRPDIVLMDLGMPGMTGYDAIGQVRAASSGASMLLVALTGWGDIDARRRSKAAGFDHHLVKPIDFDAARTLLDL